jgi:hypothetical protein
MIRLGGLCLRVDRKKMTVTLEHSVEFLSDRRFGYLALLAWRGSCDKSWPGQMICKCPRL